MQLANPQPITPAELVQLAKASKGKIRHLYLHWTAGRYKQVFDDYHLSIDGEGNIYSACESLEELKAHTWQRNSHSVGISLCCCLDALYCGHVDGMPKVNFGSYPPTQLQIETMAKVIALLAHYLGLPINEKTVMTHQEAAALDGYGPFSGDPQTRWDLWYLLDLPLSAQLKQGGYVLRGKAIWYQLILEQTGAWEKLWADH